MSSITLQIQNLIESQDIAALSKLIAPLKDDEIQTIFPGDILCVPLSVNVWESIEGPNFYQVTDISTIKVDLETGRTVEISGTCINGQGTGKSRTQRFSDFAYNRRDEDGKYWVLTWIVFPISEARTQRKKQIANEEKSNGVEIDPDLDIY